MKKIFIVEDDPKIAGLLKEYLEKYQYEVTLAENFNQIKVQFEEIQPHLILLDVNLPYFDGFYWCRQIRTISNCPIIFISARNGDMDQVLAIENGADDYIMKPFHFEVVIAKIKSILRRVYGEYANEKQAKFLSIGELELDLEAMEIIFQQKKLPLTKKEFILLKNFMQRINQVVSREFLLELLWDDQNFVDDNTLSVNVTRIRKKLAELGIEDTIETVRGVGYKMVQIWMSNHA